MLSNNNTKRYFSLVTMLFFMWGFITCLNDILIPHFKAVFSLNYTESMLVQFAFFAAYFIGGLTYYIVSSVYGDPINKIGYQNGILLGLAVSATGTFLFYPAAVLVSFPFFLMALFVLALGFTLLQIAANPYVTLLGNPETGSHRLSLAGAFNSLGTTIAPLLGGIFILKTAGAEADINSVKMPYLVLTGLFIVLFIIFKLSHLPRFSNNEHIEKGIGALKYPQLSLGVLAIFFYVGGEVTVGSFMTSFVGLPTIKGIAAEQATTYVALYWGSLMIGRFTGAISVFTQKTTTRNVLTVVVPGLTFIFILLIFYIKNLNHANGPDLTEMWGYAGFIAISVMAFMLGQSKPALTLSIFSIFCIILLCIGIYTEGNLAMWAIISLGLYNSIMWPAIFALALSGLGKYTSQGSSLLVMAILGGALVPPIQGMIADNIGVQISFWIPVICYAYLLFYGWKVKSILQKQGVDSEQNLTTAH